MIKTKYVVCGILLGLAIVAAFAAQQTIDLGTGPTAGDGDTIYDGFDKVNDNDTELYGSSVTAGDGLRGGGTTVGGATIAIDVNAKGDIITATANDTTVIVPVGSDDHVLTADSSAAAGFAWYAAGAASEVNDLEDICTGILAGQVPIGVSPFGGEAVYTNTTGSGSVVRSASAVITSPALVLSASIASTDDGQISFDGTNDELRIGDGAASLLWSDDSKQVLKEHFTTAGDLFLGTGSGTFTVKGIGADDTVLVADSGETGEAKWSTIGTASITDDTILAEDLYLTDALAAGQDNYILSYNHPDGNFTLVAGGAGVTDHGALTGLTPDDDHSQYLFLDGRSGGQVAIGGTGAGDDLTLQTTSNASKGSYILSELTTNGIVKTTGGTGTLDVETTIDTAEIENGTIKYEDMNSTGTETDGYTLSFATGGTFALIPPVVDTDTKLLEEEVEDFVGTMLGGTETRIAVTYVDGDENGTGTISFVVEDMNDDTPEAADNDFADGVQLDGDGSITDESITEGQFDITDAPSSNQVLSWTGTELDWISQASLSEANNLEDVNTDILDDEIAVGHPDGDKAQYKALPTGAMEYDPGTNAFSQADIVALSDVTAKTGAGSSTTVVFDGSPTIYTPTLTLNNGTNPAPLTEGDIRWDNNDERLHIGDGSTTRVFSDDTKIVLKSTFDAIGDILGATADDTPAILSVGTDGKVLTADSGAATGFSWQTPASGVTDHGLLDGREDDDHAGYLWLDGRTGGQTIVGGSAFGDDLTFQTTSDGIKGDYVFSELSSGLVKTTSGGVIAVEATVDTDEIENGTILPADLNTSNAAEDDYFVTFNAAESNFSYTTNAEINDLNAITTGIGDDEVPVGDTAGGTVTYAPLTTGAIDYDESTNTFGQANLADLGDVSGTTGLGETVVLQTEATITEPTITLPTLTLKNSASPTPATEGDIQWDNDDHQIKVGTGAGTVSFYDVSKLVTRAYFNAPGDILTATADDSPSILSAGTDGYVLSANSSEPKGLEWIAPVVDTDTQLSGDEVKDFAGEIWSDAQTTLGGITVVYSDINKSYDVDVLIDENHIDTTNSPGDGYTLNWFTGGDLTWTAPIVDTTSIENSYETHNWPTGIDAEASSGTDTLTWIVAGGITIEGTGTHEVTITNTVTDTDTVNLGIDLGGTGFDIFTGMNGNDLEFNSLDVAGTNNPLSLADTTDEVTITFDWGQADHLESDGEISNQVIKEQHLLALADPTHGYTLNWFNGDVLAWTAPVVDTTSVEDVWETIAVNGGGGSSVTASGADDQLTINGAGSVTVTSDGSDTITITGAAGSGADNAGENLGGGADWYAGMSGGGTGDDLTFRSLTTSATDAASNPFDVTQSATEVDIEFDWAVADDLDDEGDILTDVVGTNELDDINNPGFDGQLMAYDNDTGRMNWGGEPGGTSVLNSKLIMAYPGWIVMDSISSSPSPGAGTNQAGLYANSPSSDTYMYAVSEGGSGVKISPHDDDGYWVHDGFNHNTGYELYVEMEVLMEWLAEQWAEDTGRPIDEVFRKIPHDATKLRAVMGKMKAAKARRATAASRQPINSEPISP